MKISLRGQLSWIISILLLFSLALVTCLVWLMAGTSVESTEHENNDEINAIAAWSTEHFLNNILDDSSSLLSGKLNDDAFSTLFKTDPPIAAFKWEGKMRPNLDFFKSNDLKTALLDKIPASFASLSGAEAELFNASSWFSGLPILAMSFKRGNSGAVVYFSSQTLTELYGSGANSSFLIDRNGNVLIHPNQELIKKGTNLRNDPVVRQAINKKSEDSGSLLLFNARVNFLRMLHQIWDGFPSAGKDRGEFVNDTELSGRFTGCRVISYIPAEVVFAGVTATARRNIYLALGVWALAMLFVWYFSLSLTKPLMELQGAAGQIEQGRYHQELENHNRDETGILTKSVVSMSHALSNFERLTNRKIALMAREGKLSTGGAEKTATIFFSDIRSFTAMSEKLKPEQVVAFLNDYLERMVACVLATGGAIDKFIGDAVFAHWGAVDSSGSPKTDALASLRCALLMRAALACYNHERVSRGDKAMRIGCAINTGQVIAGQIGSDERLEFTVIGEAVSLADRTETFNKPFGTEILMTENTWKLAGRGYRCEEMPSIPETEGSGQRRKVRMFAVINTASLIENTWLFAALKKMPNIDMNIAKRYIGPEGPKTIAELRALLQIPEPDLSKVDVSGEEKKYKLSENQKAEEKIKA